MGLSVNPGTSESSTWGMSSQICITHIIDESNYYILEWKYNWRNYYTFPNIYVVGVTSKWSKNDMKGPHNFTIFT